MTEATELKRKAAQQLQSFLDDCGIKDPAGKKILEIGFKRGYFLEACLENSMQPAGTEIEPSYYENVKSYLSGAELILCRDDTIALPDESIDYIVSFQVLEHVRNLDTLIDECVRLLKPGGIMYHICPNYFSFYEGHYKILWLPFLNKATGRGYLKLLGRYSPYYETLTIIKRKTIIKLLKNYQQKLDILSLGNAEFVRKFDLAHIGKIDQKFIRFFLSAIHKIGLLSRCILGLISAAGLYYPLTIIAVKK